MSDFSTVENRRLHKQNTPQTKLDIVHTEGCRVLPNRDALLERMPRGAVAAEVGVAFGEFTQRILRLSVPKRLHLIDSWEDKRFAPGYDKVTNLFKGQIDSGIVSVSRGYSTAELEKFDDEYFDWVYIDTNHMFSTTFMELALCDRKVKKNGLIAGHDFCTGNVIDPVPYGVIEACSKFCVEYGWAHHLLALEANGHFSFCLRRL